MLVEVINKMKEDFIVLEHAHESYISKVADTVNISGNLFKQLKDINSNMDFLSASLNTYLPFGDKENLQHTNMEVYDGQIVSKRSGKRLSSTRLKKM